MIPSPSRQSQRPHPASIVIIEDNDDLAFGIRRSLEGEGYHVAIAPDGPSGLTTVRAMKPDLVLLDIRLPGDMDGYRTLVQIRQSRLDMPVLILTARGEEADKVHGFRLGADDYVVKPFGLSELLARVNALLRRSRSISAEGLDVLTFSDVEVIPSGHVVTKGGKHVPLTPREFALLMVLLKNPGKVMSRLDLLREVWQSEAAVLTRTVDIHIGELRKKLENVPAKPEYIVTIWGTGYRFDP